MTEDGDFVPPARLRVGQIIAGALLLGQLIFLGVAVFVVQVQNDGQGLAEPQGPPLVTVIALAWLLILAVASIVVPRMIVRRNLRSLARRTGQTASDAAALLGLWQTALIIGLALLEGAAFNGLIAYLLEARPYVLIAVATPLLLMLFRFPRERGVRTWLQQQQEFLERERERMDSQV